MDREKQAQVIEVIRTTLERRGKGEYPDPVRILTQYWTKDGELLAEVDPMYVNVHKQLPSVSSKIKFLADGMDKYIVDIGRGLANMSDSEIKKVLIQKRDDLRGYRDDLNRIIDELDGIGFKKPDIRPGKMHVHPNDDPCSTCDNE